MALILLLLDNHVEDGVLVNRRNDNFNMCSRINIVEWIFLRKKLNGIVQNFVSVFCYVCMQKNTMVNMELVVLQYLMPLYCIVTNVLLLLRSRDIVYFNYTSIVWCAGDHPRETGDTLDPPPDQGSVRMVTVATC